MDVKDFTRWYTVVWWMWKIFTRWYTVVRWMWNIFPDGPHWHSRCERLRWYTPLRKLCRALSPSSHCYSPTNFQAHMYNEQRKKEKKKRKVDSPTSKFAKNWRKKQQLIGHCVTTAMSVSSSKLKQTSMTQWPLPIQKFPVSSLLIMLCLDVWIQILLNKSWYLMAYNLLNSSFCW